MPLSGPGQLPVLLILLNGDTSFDPLLKVEGGGIGFEPQTHVGMS
jgi:hypothetical protein